MGDPHPFIRGGFVMNRLLNPVTRRLRSVTTLTVRGRKSGELRVVPLGRPLEFEGVRYLVSGRGETHWARNLRAAGGGELRINGRREPFRAVEIVGPDRERVLAAYRTAVGRSAERYFREIPDPADHPTFRIEPVG